MGIKLCNNVTLKNVFTHENTVWFFNDALIASINDIKNVAQCKGYIRAIRAPKNSFTDIFLFAILFL
jgi:hypothetical protein